MPILYRKLPIKAQNGTYIFKSVEDALADPRFKNIELRDPETGVTRCFGAALNAGENCGYDWRPALDKFYQKWNFRPFLKGETGKRKAYIDSWNIYDALAGFEDAGKFIYDAHIGQEWNDDILNKLPLYSLIGIGDARGKYISADNPEPRSRHTVMVIGYLEDGTPLIYDLGKIHAGLPDKYKGKINFIVAPADKQIYFENKEKKELEEEDKENNTTEQKDVEKETIKEKKIPTLIYDLKEAQTDALALLRELTNHKQNKNMILYKKGGAMGDGWPKSPKNRKYKQDENARVRRKMRKDNIAAQAHTKQYRNYAVKEHDAQKKLEKARDKQGLPMSGLKAKRAYKQRDKATWKKRYHYAKKEEYWDQKNRGISNPKTKAKIKKSQYRPKKADRKDTRQNAKLNAYMTRNSLWK